MVDIPEQAVQEGHDGLPPSRQLYIDHNDVREILTASAPYLSGVKVKDEGKLLMDVTQAIFPEGWTMSNRNAVADGIRIVLSAIEVAPSPREQALEEAAKLCDRGGAWDIADSIRALKSQPAQTGGGDE